MGDLVILDEYRSEKAEREVEEALAAAGFVQGEPIHRRVELLIRLSDERMNGGD